MNLFGKAKLFRTTKIMPPAKAPDQKNGYAGSYDRTTSINIPAGNNVTLITLRIPQGLTFLLKKFGNDLGQASGWSYVKWNILRNGIPIPAYGNIYNQLGNAQLLRGMIEDTEFRGGDVMSVTATNEHIIDAFDVLASLQGEFRRGL